MPQIYITGQRCCRDSVWDYQGTYKNAKLMHFRQRPFIFHKSAQIIQCRYCIQLIFAFAKYIIHTGALRTVWQMHETTLYVPMAKYCPESHTNIWNITIYFRTLKCYYNLRHVCRICQWLYPVQHHTIPSKYLGNKFNISNKWSQIYQQNQDTYNSR